MRLCNHKFLQEIVIHGLKRPSQEKFLSVLESAFDSWDRTGEDIMLMIDDRKVGLRRIIYKLR